MMSELIISKKEGHMTCIVGLRHQGRLYFGGDAICVSSYNKTINRDSNNKTINRDSKVFKRKGILFGTTGPVTLRNLLQYRLELPAYTEASDPMTYLMHAFLEALHACFQKDGFEQEDKGRRCFEGRSFLVCEASSTSWVASTTSEDQRVPTAP